MQQSMFDIQYDTKIQQSAPLAVRMRPKSIEDFIGQGQIVGQGRMLNRLIQADRLSSAVFYGPPGSGKTTLAKIIAETTKSNFFEINAVVSGKKDILDVIEKAKADLTYFKKRSILFIDEIHRFNKAQQDLLLPSVEEGLITLIGATTENPYFEINSPLLSRSTIFEFKKLTRDEVVEILKRALSDTENGLGLMDLIVEPEALYHLADVSSGDARRALNALELASLTGEVEEDGYIHIDTAAAQECIQKKALVYDKDGDMHYDVISAFIKSMRGSDPDAAVFWLARMLESGEDPLFIARRMVILASEDIGNADPHALPLAVSCMQAVQMIGLPEAQLNLSQTAAYLASAPKSNAATEAISRARRAVRGQSHLNVPAHLQDAHYKGSAKLGRGLDYKYPHNYEGNWVLQQYLPDDLTGSRFYEPTENGYEQVISERLKTLEKLKEE